MPIKLDALLADQRQKVAARDTGDWLEKEQILIESCHVKQRAFVLDHGRRVCALVARGGGKTTGVRARLVRRMLRTPKARCLFIATTRAQAEELMWAPLKDLLEKLGIQARFNETKLRCTLLKNGSTLRLVGADDKREIEKLRGQPFHEVAVDESASYPSQLLDHLLFRIIGPRLGDYGGVLVLIGTPGHVLSGPFYDATRPGAEIARPWDERDEPDYEDWKGWSYHHWCLLDGAPTVPAMARLWAEALVEKEANGWSDDHPVWRREYLGQWAADDTENVFRYRPHLDDGAPWNQWDPEKDPKTGVAKLPPGHWIYTYGMDMGHADPFSLQVFAYDPTRKDRTLYHVYEFEQRGMYARTIAELLVGKEWVERISRGEQTGDPGGIVSATGWPEGMVADLAGLGGAIIDELRNVYGISIEPADKKANNKHDAIELCNGDFIDGRIKIMKGSELETQLQHLQWAIDDFGRLKEHKGQANHATDALIYARRRAAHQFTEETEVAQKQGSRERFDRKTLEPDIDRERGEFDSILSNGDFDDMDMWGNY